MTFVRMLALTRFILFYAFCVIAYDAVHNFNLVPDELETTKHRVGLENIVENIVVFSDESK